MKLYLSGPMTGLPEFNFPTFHKAAKQLRSHGLDIANPAEINHGEDESTRGTKPYQVYLRAAVKMLLDCDAIVMLPGWELSRGCLTEFYIATACQYTIFFYDPDRQHLTTSAPHQEDLNG